VPTDGSEQETAVFSMSLASVTSYCHFISSVNVPHKLHQKETIRLMNNARCSDAPGGDRTVLADSNHESDEEVNDNDYIVLKRCYSS
jgi:hypothetical protein